MKKQFLLAGAALALAVAGAAAADLPPYKAPAAAAPYTPAYNWSGLYFGIQGGGAISAIPLSNVVTTGALAAFGDPGVLGGGANGFVAGGNAGFNFKFTPSMVAGVEVGAQVTGLNSNAATVPSAVLSAVSAYSIPWDGYADLKFGFLLDPSLYLYGIGGFSFGEVKQNSSLQVLATNTNAAFDDVHTGWNVGAGLDYAVTSHLLLGARYRYVSYGTRGLTLQDPALLTAFNPQAKAAFNEFTLRATVPLY